MTPLFEEVEKSVAHFLAGHWSGPSTIFVRGLEGNEENRSAFQEDTAENGFESIDVESIDINGNDSPNYIYLCFSSHPYSVWIIDSTCGPVVGRLSVDFQSKGRLSL
jgi:hypothetical protein